MASIGMDYDVPSVSHRQITRCCNYPARLCLQAPFAGFIRPQEGNPQFRR